MPRTPFKHETAEVIVVNTNEDGAPKAKDGKLTLREAIELSQQKPGVTILIFTIPTASMARTFKWAGLLDDRATRTSAGN